MKRLIAVLFLAALLALFTGCEGAQESQGIVQNGEDIETDVIPDGSEDTEAPVTEAVPETEEDNEMSAEKLKKEVERHIALSEYGKAVSLAEENIDTVKANEKEFESVLDDILIHFSAVAKRYFTNTVTYLTKQEIMGYSFDTGIEGYDPESGTIDPHVFEELLSTDDKVALERVRIEVLNADNYDFKVTIEICGMTAVYPSEDEILR